MVLLILSACSGGDDVTSPPGSLTLTVTGNGTGSGRVASSAGVQPAITCDLAGTATPTGVCSASYAEGTIVVLTVVPGTNSTFDGWAGDAASCGTAPSCSLTMSKNQTTTAQLSSSVSAGVEIISSAFYPDPNSDGAAWVVEVRNATSQLVENADIEITVRDAAGQILTTNATFVGPIPPGQTRAIESFADYVGTGATADLRVTNVQFGSGDANLGAAAIISSNWRADLALDAVVWTVEVRNTTGAQLESVQVDFSTYDAAGKIVAAGYSVLGPIPPGETRSTEDFAEYRGTEASARFQVASVE